MKFTIKKSNLINPSYSFFGKMGILGLVVLLLAVAGCENKKNAPVEENATASEKPATDNKVTLTPEQVQMADIRLGHIEKKNISTHIACRGSIEIPPGDMLGLYPPAHGFVEAFDLIVGQEVQKGQTLLRLSHPDYIDWQAALVEVKGQLVYLEKEFERQKTLAAQNATAQKNLQKTEADFISLKSKKASLEGRIRNLGIDPNQVDADHIQTSIAIVSPTKGFVTDIQVHAGQFVNMQDEMLMVIDRSHLHAHLKVFEQDIVKVEKGQTVEISIPNLPEKTLIGKIEQIGQIIDEETRTLEVHVHLKELEPYLKPGMFINGRILLNSDSVMALPELAIVQNGDMEWVFVSEGNYTYQKVPVRAGVTQNGFRAINPLQGFPNNAEIVVSGANYLEAAMAEE